MDKPKGTSSFKLDALGQQARINRLYTQLTLCFPLPQREPSSFTEAAIIERLRKGFQRLCEGFPWIAGQVFKRNDIFVIETRTSTVLSTLAESRVLSIPYKEAGEVPCWHTLELANFPFSMLNEVHVAPRRTLCDEEEASQGLPVFLAQANFIDGGVLLTINGQHGSMDMAGQAQMMSMFAKACREETFLASASELRICNVERDTVFPLTDLDSILIKEPKDSRQQPPGSGETSRNTPSAPKEVQWAYFSISAASLAALKALAMEDVHENGFVSTDDALSAFVWQGITRARRARRADTSAMSTTLSRNVDVRSALSIPPTYPGLAVTSTTHSYSVDVLLETRVGIVAELLRSALNPIELARNTRISAARILHRADTNVSKGSDPEWDVRLSSWAKERCYDLDFGFGKPVAVRRPSFIEGAREGLVYILPKALDGEIVVGVCLRPCDLRTLRLDKDFVKFAQYIG